MTKNEALRQCISLWKYIADNDVRSDKKKSACYVVLGDYPIHGCPACEYAESLYKAGEDGYCRHCPIDKWNDGPRCFDAELQDWEDAKTTQERRAAALAIVKLAEESLEPEA